MRNKNILVVGASVAGPALAYWLQRYGFTPTVVERAPELRTGGQAVDVRGAALVAAERMGLLGEIRAGHTAMKGMSFVDDDGTELMRTTEETLTGGATDGADVEILRDDLAGILYRASLPGTEYIFGDHITALSEQDSSEGNGEVLVTFAHAEQRAFGLVIGADGLHSSVRRLAFGPESEFIAHLGTYLSVFSTDNFLDLDHWQVFHQSEGKMSGVYSARNNTEARAVMGFSSDVLEFDHRDSGQQKQIVADKFAGDGWETGRLLKAMWAAPDFYFDSMAQIRMGSWSTGRCALVGDAGYCGSPMTGQGTSLALIGAYVLAGELKAADGDHDTAFAGYEREMRDFVELNHRVATDTPGVPATPETMARVSTAITLKTYA